MALTNHVSMEREVIRESNLFQILTNYLDFTTLRAVFTKLSNLRAFSEIPKNIKLVERKHAGYHIQARDLETTNSKLDCHFKYFLTQDVQIKKIKLFLKAY